MTDWDDDSDWEYDAPQSGRIGYDETRMRVLLPSGTLQPVMTVDEQEYLTRRVELYTDHNKFTNISDLQDLDRVLIMEVMVHRWGLWLGTGIDYNESPVDELVYQRELSSYSTELRQLKKMLGIDKPARDRQSGDGSVAHYWNGLLERARAFGIMRNRQLDKALELTNQLIGLVTFHDNATDKERAEFHATDADIIDWVRTVYTPEYQAIDEHFRSTQQRFWIRTQ